MQKKKRKESATGGKESANNKYRTGTGRRERELHPTLDRREDNSLKRERNEREKKQTPSFPLTRSRRRASPSLESQHL